ncbi:MAG TPA: DUF4136 domain-containing protein [Candidatus Solibacter sp.]|nr:DUF4136 domain-containing protein [Candidatus Solibacter sp.]
MLSLQSLKTTKFILSTAAILSVALVAGCDEYVRVTHDPDVRIPKNATWAWRPAVQEPVVARATNGDDRRVLSRDQIARNQAPPPREAAADDAVDRERVKTAIEQTLASKGFKQVSDPRAAEFLVDYKFAVHSGNATVPVGYAGAYPGLVCGPFRCWQSWGYGPAYVGYENIHFREGTIVFDWMQQPTKHRVYRAVGAKPVHYDNFSLTQNDINSLVHALLKDLKPGK